MKQKLLNRRDFIKISSIVTLGFAAKPIYALDFDPVIQENPKGLVKITLNANETNIKQKIRKKAKQKLGCYLFGRPLDEIEEEVKFILSHGLNEIEFIVPDNFLVNEMYFSIEVIKKKKPELNVYQDYKGNKIHLLNAGVGLGGWNKVHTNCKTRYNSKAKKYIDHSKCQSKLFPTPKGDFFLKRIISNPCWYPPKKSWSNQKNPSKPGKNNPYGLWMSELSTDSSPGNHDWGISGDSKVRIHSTNKPKSIGKYSSHGCIRVHPTIAENELFPGLLYNSKHDKPKTHSRGTIHPLHKPIPISIT